MSYFIPCTVKGLGNLVVDTQMLARGMRPEMDAFTGDFLDNADRSKFEEVRLVHAAVNDWPLLNNANCKGKDNG